jgi:hypothetical protein
MEKPSYECFCGPSSLKRLVAKNMKLNIPYFVTYSERDRERRKQKKKKMNTRRKIKEREIICTTCFSNR